MSAHTTLRVGGPAEVFCQPATGGEMERVLEWAGEVGVPVRMLGAGSNLLVSDRGVRGVVIRTAPALDFACAGDPGEGRLTPRVGGGRLLAPLVVRAARRGWRGLGPLAGIPGTLAGAVIMNAGTPEGSISGAVRAVRVWDARRRRSRWVENEDCGFGYRTSAFAERPHLVVLAARLQLERGDAAELLAGLRRRLRLRAEKQPLQERSAGSVFRNPPERRAGYLIDAAGCKGWSVGGARVSRRHANFIVTREGATAADVLRLADRVRERVLGEFGVELEMEIRTWGVTRCCG